MSDSVRPHRQQPTRLPHPWDSPGKNTGVGCHFLLQCMKVKSESEVTQPINPLVSKMRSYRSSKIYRLIQSLTAGLNQSRTRTLVSQLQANLLPLGALHVCLFLCNRIKAPKLWIPSDYFAAFFLSKVCYHSQKTLTFTRLWICDCAISK